ncbi:GEVED domain-containing protein [Chryseobacterium paridis]|uniref:T9SS type A sorting domain-containing protein n=1 Tax=Chryseobacterium paridis TaxID=2800328 RepID=A0ABS1FYR3_9FLAO|nr:GEVED domain-containing protein [Chryseobacterium paridis]MBK1897478.1 T9SS type A sorting domain-containing protein [Chryseobacterium paridis]
MTKNLLYVFLFLIGISFFNGKNQDNIYSSSALFCDTNAPANVQVSNITATSAVITWTFDPTTPDYLIRFRPVGGTVSPWTTVTISTLASFTLTGLIPCSQYEVQVAKICSGVVGTWSGSIIFVSTLNYCLSGSTDSGLMHISNVMVSPGSGGFLPMVSNSGASNYTDYRNDPSRKVNLLVGSTGNMISVTKAWSGVPSAASISVWIDLNGNGVFEATEKIVFSGSNTSASPSATFSIPSTAFQTAGTCGVTMRVMMTQALANSACGTFVYGEVEDYGVALLTSGSLSTVENQKSKEINIYPNPVSNVVTIDGIVSDLDYEIYNTAGQKIKTGKSADRKVNVHDLIRGVYFIQLKEKEKVTRLKFIKN